jgi:hypothetical protein
LKLVRDSDPDPFTAEIERQQPPGGFFADAGNVCVTAC